MKEFVKIHGARVEHFFYFGNVELSVKFSLSLHAAGALLKKQEAPITLLSNFEKKTCNIEVKSFKLFP